MASPLLAVRDLQVQLRSASGPIIVTAGVDFEIAPGEAVGLIGESGSGKSITARAIARLLPPGAKISGEVEFDGSDVLKFDARKLARYRSADVGFIFQDPAAHINPVRTIGDFMTEVLIWNQGMAKEQALDRARAALDEVGISFPEMRLRQYPHQLSGGMLQRVMIASVLLQAPRLIIADEPTTALDLITQADIIRLLREVRASHASGLLFISHDLELATATCDRTLVMYAGGLVEEAPSATLEHDPLHPYTARLLAARPSAVGPPVTLATIPGQSVPAFRAPEGCAFAPRCTYVQDACRSERPPLGALGHGAVACRRASELRGQLTIERPERVNG